MIVITMMVKSELEHQSDLTVKMKKHFGHEMKYLLCKILLTDNDSITDMYLACEKKTRLKNTRHTWAFCHSSFVDYDYTKTEHLMLSQIVCPSVC